MCTITEITVPGKRDPRDPDLNTDVVIYDTVTCDNPDCPTKK